MKIALAQLNYHIGNFEANTSKIISAIDKAKSMGADLVVFSELAVCGYPPRDFLSFHDFIERCQNAIDQICEASKDIAVLVGTPTRNPKVEGKDLHNSAFFIVNGVVENIIHKTLLPTYDIFDEYRYFQPNTEFSCIEFMGEKIAVTICEDIWNVGTENPMYTSCPMDFLQKENPAMMINLSASPYNYRQAQERSNVISANAALYHIPVFYCNQVGGQTELIFDGGSAVYNAEGKLALQLPYFEECISIIESNNLQAHEAEFPEEIAGIHDALVLGIRDYFEKMGFKKAILGLSGGVDSALTLCLAVTALGKENVMSVLLPSQYSSDHSVDDSLKLVANLDSPHIIVPIQETVDAALHSLHPFFQNLPEGLAEENIQARARAILLMGLSNKLGYILLNTSNKSEAAVGYGTLYGDMCGGISVLGDLYKTRVYELCRYINREGEIIPENILTKAPSAELRPGQKDSDSLPEYDILDQILYQYIDEKKGPREISEQGYDPALVARILKMVNTNEWKRYQTPPILRISQCAFGMGRRMPIVGKYLG